jgi:excisionase family DNA binding protein
MTGPLLLPVPVAAQRLGIGRDAAYRFVREGRLRTLSVGRRVLVPLTELEDFIRRELNAGTQCHE